ncbi:MAG: TonB-dependent receptor [Sphingobacteriales bacterium]|nr:MAG: TonB-dependent receptor [Sphingobacteriales bacterium]
MQKRSGLLAVLFLCLSAVAFGQGGTIKGFVYDRSTGEPMIFTNVLLEGTKLGVQTDVNGYFSLPQVPEGTYTLFTSLVGYDTSRTTITVTPNSVITKKLFLGTKQTELKGVEISARKTEKITQVNAGTITVTAKDIKLMPSSGGEPDIAQYLQVVPGVVFTGDQGGQLYIRGGAPSQTGILLDGVTIYNPFHSIGLYSVFETDAIRNVDVQTAGFGAQYGNRTSAILDVRTKDGNKNRLAGKVSASPIMARVMLEGPLVKAKREGGSAVTFLLSAKHSYLSSTSESIYGGFGEPFKSGLPFDFTDLYGKITLSGDNGSKLNFFGFNFKDKARLLDPSTHTENAAYKWNAAGGGATFVVTPGSSSALINGRLAYSKYDVELNEANYVPRKSGVSGFEGAIDFTYYFPRYSQIRYGIEVSGLYTTLDYVNDKQITSNLERRNTTGAIYVSYRKNFSEKFIFEPSFRAQYYSSLSKLSPEPRLAMKYNITNNVRLKAAGGLYSQNLLSTKSDRDIVNLFTGFILSPDESLKNTEGKEVTTNLQTAYHALGGIEVDIDKVELTLEPWYKNFRQLIEFNRNQQFASDPDFQVGSGLARGIDLSARYSRNRLYLWGVVSYQKIDYKSIDSKGAIQTYPPPFDRRMNINLLASYAAGKKKDWDLSARLNVGSPFPFTQTQGFYETLDPTEAGIQTNINTQNGSIGILYADAINGGRLSWYHRFDLSARKRFILSTNSNIETTLSVSNVYNRNNIFYVDRLSNSLVYQLPIFPSLNVTWNF